MRIELVAPEAVFAGTEVTLEIAIVTDEITRIAFADADLVGSQGWTVGSGTDEIHEETSFPREHLRLLGERLLAMGSTTRCKFAVTLPEDLPPSHELHPAFAHVEVTVHVSVAGGRDARGVFRLPIRAATPRTVTRTPVSVRTRVTRQADPRLEMSLASSRLVAGEVMVGSLAVFHVDDRKAQQVEFVLEPRLGLLGRQLASLPGGDLHRFHIEIPEDGAGRVVPFQIRVPEVASPTFRATTHALAWRVVARLHGLELELPLEILDVSAGAATASLMAAPPLAALRVAAVFEAFAAHHGWWADHATIARTDIATGVELRLSYEYRGEDGTFLVARCRYPSLGVGLDVLPSSGLRQLFSHGIQLGIAAWDERHLVHARNATQIVAPLRAVVPSLLSAGVLGELARWRDDELVIERKLVTLDTADLLAASDALARIAGNLGRARDLVSPPAEIEVDLPAWRRLARGWGSELSPGNLALAGAIDRVPVRLGLRFDERGAPVALVASVGPMVTAIGDVSRWPAEIADLRIADGVATAEWRWKSPRLEVAHARTLVESLRALVEAPTAGPYR